LTKARATQKWAEIRFKRDRNGYRSQEKRIKECKGEKLRDSEKQVFTGGGGKKHETNYVAQTLEARRKKERGARGETGRGQSVLLRVNDGNTP